MKENSLLEISDSDIRNELDRRTRERDGGKCDACLKWYDEPSCGNPRHSAASTYWYKKWKWDHGSSYLTVEKHDSEYSMTISRYGTKITLFGPDPNYHSGRSFVAETELPVDYTDDHPRSNKDDRERFIWAVNWAEKQIQSGLETEPCIDCGAYGWNYMPYSSERVPCNECNGSGKSPKKKSSTFPTFPDIGCSGECEFIVAGAGLQCQQPDCGRYIHHDQKEYAAIVEYDKKMKDLDKDIK